VPIVRRHLPWLWAACFGALCSAPAVAGAETKAERTGGVSIKRPRTQARQAPPPPARRLRQSPAEPVAPPPPPVPRAQIVDGQAVAPPGAPPRVVGAITAANRIVTKPYRYGGGHRSFEDSGYDCSGSVSYALSGGGLLRTPLDSRSFAKWGVPGRGTWITVYTNPSHAYVVIAGRRLDTSGSQRMVQRYGGVPGSGPRWRAPRSSRGYVLRHFPGL
jgi:hypothetical protein